MMLLRGDLPVFLKGGLAFGLLCLCLFPQESLIAVSAEGQARPMLTGGIQKDAILPAPTGTVTSSRTGLPISGAMVSIPDSGLYAQTGQDGTFDFPEGGLGDKPVIINVTKPGYAPESRMLVAQAQHQGPLQIQIREQYQVLVIDDKLRHLGDNSYSPYSSGAGNFQKGSEGAVMTYSFVLKGRQPSSNKSILQIGTIIGMDTSEAHALKQSAVPFASTPVIIRLNGTEIGHLNVNGDHQRIQVATSQLNLNGINVLEIEAGYQIRKDTRIDYDDLEIMNVQLEL